jgi:hypothetical protein
MPAETAPSRRILGALDRAFGASTGEGYEGEAHGFVHNTPEVDRILKLPRTDWRTRSDLDDLVDLLTAEFKTPGGAMRLRPIQAVTLESLHDHAGTFGAIGVGEGKTLISFLAPTVMKAARPLLIVPAKLKLKTEREFSELRKHWIEISTPTIVSYEWLGRVNAETFLDDLEPDFIAADEAHKLKNPRAAVSRRFVRYGMKGTATMLVMSGTVANRSLLDFHHLLALTVGVEGMPLPAPREEAKTWAAAVDEKVNGRARPGALRFFLPPKAKPSLANIRAAVGKRIHETPGVVNTTRKSVEASIIVDTFNPTLPGIVEHHLHNLTANKTAPNGDEALPSDVYRHARTLCSGFFYQWDPPPPRDWCIARAAWKNYARDVLEEEDERFDSELQVANGVRRGVLEDGGALARWQAVRDDFKPNAVPVWLTTSILEEALEHDTGRSIIWVEHIATGIKLSEMSGLPYFHRLGLTSEGAFIGDHKGGSLIASIAANAEGRNLQRYAHNLIITPPASGRTWEQLLGRTHRPGQQADEVMVDVMLGSPTIAEQMRQAIKDARFIAATTGQAQKLLQADFSAF